jgi:hypothetical protein
MHFCGVDSVDGSTASRHDDPRELKKYLDHLKFQSQLVHAMPAELAHPIAGSVSKR